MSVNILKFSKSHWNVNVKGTAYLDQRMVFHTFVCNIEYFEILNFCSAELFIFSSYLFKHWHFPKLVAANLENQMTCEKEVSMCGGHSQFGAEFEVYLLFKMVFVLAADMW